MLLALILFILAALGGVLLLALRLMDRPLPMLLAVLHGSVAAAGLFALALQVLGGRVSGGLPIAALVLFTLAALAAATVFSFHLRGKPVPLPLVLVHAAVAASGIVCLFMAVIGMP